MELGFDPTLESRPRQRQKHQAECLSGRIETRKSLSLDPSNKRQGLAVSAASRAASKTAAADLDSELHAAAWLTGGWAHCAATISSRHAAHALPQSQPACPSPGVGDKWYRALWPKIQAVKQERPSSRAQPHDCGSPVPPTSGTI